MAVISKPDESLPTQEKQWVAFGSLLAAATLTSMKAVVGLLTGSLGILSEAAHSGLDLVAALVTLISVRLADRPADSSHPFGHGKFEALSAFVQTGLLLMTCAWIVWESIARLFYQRVEVEPSWWAFGIMAASMVIDFFRSSSLSRAAKKYQSQALEADALHFFTDIFSSGVVILGLILVTLARRLQAGWLHAADTFAALVVAAITIALSAQLGKRTLDALLDAAPAGSASRISRAVGAIPGVMRQDRIRVRHSGSKLFVELRLTLSSNIPLEHAQALENEVESKVLELFPGADVVIQIVPETPSTGDLVERIRAIAHRNNFQIHDVTPIEVDGKVNVNLDLELEPYLTLEKAHEKATFLEAEITSQLPQIADVNIHIEPLLRRVEPAHAASIAMREMEQKLQEIARDTPGLLDCHSLEAHQVGGSIMVTLHCTLEKNLPLERVHDITEGIEFRFRQNFPQILKVNIHAEPSGV
jgi:cation diffusion facilitator family transporter